MTRSTLVAEIEAPGYVAFPPNADWWQPTREEIALAEVKTPRLIVSDEDIRRYLNNILADHGKPLIPAPAIPSTQKDKAA